MQDVIEHCDTILNNIKLEITTLERNLRSHTEEDQFVEIKKAITINQETRKRTIQQTKNKKIYTLKYNHRKPHVQSQQTSFESHANQHLENNTNATPLTG